MTTIDTIVIQRKIKSPIFHRATQVHDDKRERLKNKYGEIIYEVDDVDLEFAEIKSQRANTNTNYIKY